MNDKYLAAVFNDEHDLVKTSHELKSNNVEIEDFYTPFPVHGLDELLGITRSRLPYVTFFAGLTGLIFALSFQVWTSSVDWPINVGGKPMLSIPAFIPIAFELMVLFGALTTVAAFFFISRLFPSKKVNLIHQRQLDDKFLVLIKINENLDVIEKIIKDSACEWKFCEKESV